MPRGEKKVKYREIVTKAVCGKGKKHCKSSHKVNPSQKPSSILGCWIINHKYEADRKGDSIEINGSYDINVWYSYEDNTKTDVMTETVTYRELVPLTMKESDVMSEDMDVIARAIKQPNTLEASIGEHGSHITVDVEKEFSCEVVGETKFCIQIHPEEEDENYRDIKWDEQVADEEFKEIDHNFLGPNNKS